MMKPKGKYAWTVTVGEKGQIVIPKQAREVFGIQPGDTLVMLGDVKRGLAIPPKKKLLEAQSYLIGLSNSFFTSRNGEDRCIDRVYEYPDIIRRNMGIAPKRDKKKG